MYVVPAGTAVRLDRMLSAQMLLEIPKCQAKKDTNNQIDIDPRSRFLTPPLVQTAFDLHLCACPIVAWTFFCVGVLS